MSSTSPLSSPSSHHQDRAQHQQHQRGQGPQGHLPHSRSPAGRWSAHRPPSPPPPCPAAPTCPPTPPTCGRPTGRLSTRSTRSILPGLVGSSSAFQLTIHLLSITSWLLLTGSTFAQHRSQFWQHYLSCRLANIQRTLLESGAEAVSEPENGTKEEEVRIASLFSVFRTIYGSNTHLLDKLKNTPPGKRSSQTASSNNLTVLDRRASQARRQASQRRGWSRLESNALRRGRAWPWSSGGT